MNNSESNEPKKERAKKKKKKLEIKEFQSTSSKQEYGRDKDKYNI